MAMSLKLEKEVRSLSRRLTNAGVKYIFITDDGLRWRQNIDAGLPLLAVTAARLLNTFADADKKGT